MYEYESAENVKRLIKCGYKLEEALNLCRYYKAKDDPIRFHTFLRLTELHYGKEEE